MPQEVKELIDTKNFSEMDEENFNSDLNKEKKNTKKTQQYEDIASVPQSAKEAFQRKPYYMYC